MANQRRRGFLLVVTAGIWRVGAQAEAYATGRRRPTTRQVVATRTGCNQRRYGFLLVVTAEIWRLGAQTSFSRAPAGAACATGRREGSVGCRGGVFFALVVYFMEEGFEFYFLLGGHEG